MLQMDSREDSGHRGYCRRLGEQWIAWTRVVSVQKWWIRDRL